MDLQKIMRELEWYSLEQYGGAKIVDMDTIKAVLEKHIADGWIPVAIRCPDHPMKLWLTISYPSGSVTVDGWWDGVHFIRNNGKIVSDPVLAWMPWDCPKPYMPE